MLRKGSEYVAYNQVTDGQKVKAYSNLQVATGALYTELAAPILSDYSDGLFEITTNFYKRVSRYNSLFKRLKKREMWETLDKGNYYDLCKDIVKQIKYIDVS